MRDDVKRALLLGFLAGVVGLSPGCATSSATGQVQELEPGTYSVGISRTTSYLAEGDKAIASAVDKAGAHCHAKGQKFMLKSAVGKTVVFRCVPMSPGAPGPATAQAPQPLASTAAAITLVANSLSPRRSRPRLISGVDRVQRTRPLKRG